MFLIPMSTVLVKTYRLALALCLCAHMACSDEQSRARLAGDETTLRLAIPSDVNSLDPAIAYDVVGWPLVRLMYNGLIDYDDDLNLIPWQSRSWDLSEDGHTLTFVLRPGLRFSNGREIVAQDYVYSLQRVLDPKTKSPGQGFFRNIVGARAFQDGKAPSVTGLSAPNDTTFVIQLEQPDLPFLHVLAMPFAYVVPREEVAKHPTDFSQHPVGSGPFVLTLWQRGSHLRFERSPTYAHPEAIRLNGVDLRIGGDATLHMMMFERGEIDIASITANGIPAPDFVRVMNTPRLRQLVESQSLNATYYLSLNNEMPPFDNVKVRQAINYAVDRQRIISLISDRGVFARGVLPPGMPGFNPKLAGYRYDPDRAKTLLAEAGFPNGFHTELMMLAQDDTDSKIGQVVQQNLKDIGVTVDLKPVTSATSIQALSSRKSVAFGTSAWYQDYPDPSNFLNVLLNGQRITDVNCNNVAFYNNPDVNKLLEEAAHDTHQDRRIELYRQAEVIIVSEAPWVFLYHPKMYVLRQPWLKGMKLNPVWPHRFEKLRIEALEH